MPRLIGGCAHHGSGTDGLDKTCSVGLQSKQMEGKNMAGQERGARRGMLGIGARTRTPEMAVAPVLLGHEAKPTHRFPEPGKPTKEKTPSSKKALIARLAISLTAIAGGYTAGGGINEQFNDMPFSAHSVANDAMWPKSLIENIQGLFKGHTIEERFPILLSKDSFTPVSKEEEQELWKNTKTLDLESHTFVTGFPFDQTTIDRNPSLRMGQEFGGDLLSPFIDGKKLEQEGVRDVTYYTGLQKGEEFKLNYDSDRYEASIILLWKAGITQGAGTDLFTPAYTVYRVILRNKTTGDVVNKTIEGLYAEPLIQTNPLPKDHSAVYEDGAPIISGEALMQLTTNLPDWDGENQILSGQKGQFIVGTAYMQQDPRAGIPLTDKNLATSNGDIAIEQ